MLGYIVALVMLLITSYMDLRTREIDPKVWIPFIIAGAAVTIAKISLYWDQSYPSYLLLSMIPPAILFILSVFGMMGLADPIAMAIVSLLIPAPPSTLVLPPSMVILALASISMIIVLVIPMLIYNISYLGFISRRCSSKQLVAIIALTGFPVSVKRFLRSKFLYPLIYPSLEEDKVTWICRGSFEIDEDPKIHREAISALLEKRYIDEKTMIYVTWGVPYIVFILLGLLLYPLLASPFEEFIEGIYRWFYR